MDKSLTLLDLLPNSYMYVLNMERRYGQKIDRCVKLRHTAILDRHTAILDQHTAILDRSSHRDPRSSHRDPPSIHRDPRWIVTLRSSIERHTVILYRHTAILDGSTHYGTSLSLETRSLSAPSIRRRGY